MGRKIPMLGSGFIGRFYADSLHGLRSSDRIVSVYSRKEEGAKKFAEDYQVVHWTTDMEASINKPEVNVVIIALPNNLHEAAVIACAKAGKGVLCTKPLGRNALEAKRMLEIVEDAGIFHGYLEDLCFTPKFLKTMSSIQQGNLGRILWARSRETHPGPHSDWFWNIEESGGGAILDLACHCIEVTRNYIGKDIRPLEVICWADTQVKPIEAEDHAIGMVRYENGAVGQFEVSWTFRGGLDLRDEVMGTEGTVWINNFLRTGLEMFISGKGSNYVAEKAESTSGWIFPVGDEVHELGYDHMFANMFNAMDNNAIPSETFYDGYIVNAVMDAALRSVKTKKWEPIDLELWRGKKNSQKTLELTDYDEQYFLIKEETIHDGRNKLILKDKKSGKVIERVS